MAELSAREKAREAASKNSSNGKKSKFWAIMGTATAGVLVIGGIVVYQMTGTDSDNRANGNDSGGVEVTEDRTPETITTSGAFQIPGEGNDNPDAVRVDYYFDPQCPACQDFTEETKETFDEHVESGDIDLHIHPVSFMGANTPNDYSGQVANAIVTVQEEVPEHTLDFVNAVYDEEFYPQQGQTRTTEEIIDQAKSIGIPDEVADTFSDQYYHGWVKDNTDTQQQRADFFPEGQFGTPSVFIGNQEEDDTGHVTGDFTKMDMQGGSNLSETFENAVAEAQAASAE